MLKRIVTVLGGTGSQGGGVVNAPLSMGSHGTFSLPHEAALI